MVFDKIGNMGYLISLFLATGGGGVVPPDDFLDSIEVPNLPLNRGYNRVRGGYQTLKKQAHGSPARC